MGEGGGAQVGALYFESFLTRMVYLYNDIESRYTILAGNRRFILYTAAVKGPAGEAFVPGVRDQGSSWGCISRVLDQNGVSHA